MQLKLTKMPRPGQSDMVVQTKFGTRIFELGKSETVTADEAGEILAGPHAKCFEQAGGEPEKPSPQGKAVVQAARVTTKPASPEDAAAEEAAKMVSSKDYKTK